MSMILILFLLFGAVAGLGLVDKRKKRPFEGLPPLSFMVPCYNESASVGQTLASIYEVCGAGANVFVIDDGSTDGSREKLVALKAQQGFTLIFNALNLGKSRTLNDHFHLAKNDIVVFIDADVIVNRQALEDAIARLQRSDVGAVSCPYNSANPGFIPLMETIEYNMLAFIQGAYNVFSAIALWGGFIVIKREAFLKAGGFSLNAITEDMDLAFKLNENGWRVEQSFYPVRTYVPDTFSQWFLHKLRWSSGALQCFFKYYRVWLKNPLHILFVFSFCILLTFSTFNIGQNYFLWDEIIRYFLRLHQSESVWRSLQLTSLNFGVSILKDFIWYISFTLFSLPFVLPLVSTLRRIHICFLIIPFSILYVPILSSVSIIGAIDFLRKRRLLQTATRAW
jgi:cellulose synthase/poly-beta-1,6-N-acetylglucosamine synthase-like glycosyltransferase